MKYKNQTTNEILQKLIDQENQIDGQICKIQNTIDMMETNYLQKTWYDGNFLIGWNKNMPYNNPNINNVKINIDPKEKLFSLSSLSSPAFKELGMIVDRQLSPYGQQRFQSKKKKRTKKRNGNQMRRPRPIRKKKRR